MVFDLQYHTRSPFRVLVPFVARQCGNQKTMEDVVRSDSELLAVVPERIPVGCALDLMDNPPLMMLRTGGCP